MKAKTRNCSECGHRDYAGDKNHRCAKGHKPRFYMPRFPDDPDYGWKRRCSDFLVGKHV